MTVTPEAEAEAPVLLFNGTIHSTAEPYAEAMIVEDGQVAWLGSDETAERMAGDRLIRQDLDRALVAPAFVGRVGLKLSEASAVTTAEVLDVAAQKLGYCALRLVVTVSADDLADATAVQAALAETFTAAAGHPVEVYPVLRLTGVHADGGAPSIAPLNALLDLLPAVEEAAGRPAGAAVLLREVLPNLLGVRSWAAEAGHQLLIETDGIDAAEAVDAVVTTTKHLRELRQTPTASTPTLLVGFDSAERDHWEALLNTGVHVVLTGPGHLGTALSVGVPTSAVPGEGENPWQLVSDHVHSVTEAVSARAGFNALTRGAYRSLVGASETAGQLNPGTVATYAIWEVESLAVQTPHSTVAAWSTDTRARTPLLPYLDGETLPRLVSTVIAGRGV